MMLSNQIAARVTRTVGAALVCFATGSAIAVLAQNNGEWIKYTSAEGRYSVSVPQEPKVSAQETTSADGEKVPQYLASSPDGNGVFMIGYFDYKPPVTFSFDKARDSMLKAATLLGEDTVSLGNSPGRQLRLLMKTANGEEFMMRTRIYEVATRVYVLQCIFPKAEDGLVVVEKCGKFVDSFKVEPH